MRAKRCQKTDMHVKSTPIYSNLQQFTPIERLKLLYGTLGYSSLSSLWKAIDTGYLLLFPDLTLKNLSKLSISDIIVLDHIDQKLKNMKSTQPKQEQKYC